MASSIINSDDGLVSGTSGIKTTGGDDGVLNIQSNGSTVVAVDGSGVSVTGTLSSSGGYGAVSATTLTVNSNNISADNSLGFRNRIINGDMRIDQRNAGASVTPTNSLEYILDRWAGVLSVASKFSVQQNAGSVTPPTGFTNYLGATSLSAYSVGATETFAIAQYIEGYNFADLGWGTANAKTVTLSFWVRSSLTGTFGGSLRNSDNTRSYPYTYTISSADTWEYKTVTIAGDTTGTWLTTNGRGVQVIFGMGSGVDRSGTAGSWSGTNYTSATGATSVVGTNGATFYVTGVQLEVGSVATPFERRPYGTELSLCQRYFQRLGSLSGNYVGFGSGRGAGTTTVFCYMKYANTVRATPTITQSNTGINYPTQSTVTGFGSIYYGTDSAGVELTNANTVTSGVAVMWVGNNNSAAYVDISAEL